jgi:hypothetical protein
MELVLGWLFGYITNQCNKSILIKYFFPFYIVKLTPSLSYMHFFHFNDTCTLNSNGFTKFYKSLLSLIPFWRLALREHLINYR